MAQLSDNDFEIFGLPAQFELDKDSLTASYLKLQQSTHPDKFANASQAERRLAVQWATRINEAYERLSDPTNRAIYWCELQGEDPRGRQSNLPPALLMQQMEWREQLEETENIDGLDELLSEVLSAKKQSLKQVAMQIDEQQDATAATQTVQGLLFITKFLAEVKKRIEHLEDAQ